MIYIYKKYHIAYWCIGILEIIGMVIANFILCKQWNALLKEFYPDICSKYKL